MMHENRKNQTFIGVDKSIKTLNLAIKVFQEYLSDKTLADPEKYYQAHEYLEETKTLYQEALNEISNMTESLPPNASPGFIKWKESVRKGSGIISESKEFEALKSELQNDEFLLRFLTPEEIEVLLTKHYESQQLGKRKLSNIKARFIIDKIRNLMSEAETLDIKAKEKLYQLK
ncbi:MAG: hypothetical protein JSV17_13635 [Candidatus Aminicenantes bacterium]|nr:MAG: hypothetical protein JSV17_13635 [Candidatus Aminicenantes bacterium]